MKSGVKFTSITTGITENITLPYFNNVLEAQQFLINIAVNMSSVSAEMLTASANAETHRLTLQGMIPDTVSACVCIGYGALSPVNENGSCAIINYPHLTLYTTNNLNLDADTYTVNGTTIHFAVGYGGWSDGAYHTYKATGINADNLFYPINNLTMCNHSSGNVGRYDTSSSMGFGLFLPCIIPLTDGNITIQFISLTTNNLYAEYNSSTGSYIGRDASWWANQTMRRIYYIINPPKPELPSVSGDATDEINTDTGESDTQDSEDNVGGDGHVTLINNVVNYDNFTPDYSRINTGFITPYEISNSELTNLHSFLYSETILDMIKNYFAGDASKAIIDLFNIPVAPTVEAASSDIKIGVISSGASANAITNETVTFDFGSIDLTSNGYYSNTFMDLAPYNQYSIYLPFIGFRNLNTNDLRSIDDDGFKIYLKYIIDVLTGEFVAVVEADHNNAAVDNATGKITTAKLTKQVINVFNGSMRTDIPLSYRNPLQGIIPIISGLAGSVGSISGTLDSKSNAVTKAANVINTSVSGLNSVGNVNNALIPRGDNISGSIGNLTLKTAFIINQECPKYIRTGKSNQFAGYPAYKYLKLNDDRGFVKVRNVIASGFGGTAHEQEKVVELLKGGVYCK